MTEPAAEQHLHLAWYGYDMCREPGCTRPRADPAEDLACTDRYCGGSCEAARHNRERCRHLDPDIVRGIERVTGEQYSAETGSWS